MFPKSKYCKSNLSSTNYKSNLCISLQSLKYHQNIYSKKKTTLCKKGSFQSNNNKFSQNHTWKKHNSYNWNKENDKNYLNYEQYNNSNYDSNQYYYIPKEKKENKSYYNKEYSYLYSYESNEYNSNKNKNSQKKEKKFSIDYTTTQSNSSSHEESNNNPNNSNDNYSTVTNENFNSNDSQNINIEEENNRKISNSNTISDFKNLNLNSNLPIIENNNFNLNIENIVENNFQTCNNYINNIIPIFPISTPQKKNKKAKKNKKNYCPGSSTELELIKSISTNNENELQLNEPYNKFNSVNNELITPVINPIIENTEILEVNVKIAKDKNAIFKLRRFDDLFLTVKLFCEINSIEEKLMKPIITKALCTLNSIYQIYNTQLDSRNIRVLQMLKAFNNNTFI